MITKEHFVEGIVNYIDSEVMPKLPTSGKWIMGTAVMTMMPKANETVTALMNHPIVQAMAVTDESGNIDSMKLIRGLHRSAEKYGTMELSVPMVGKIKFNSGDVQRLAHYLEAIDAVAVTD